MKTKNQPIMSDILTEQEITAVQEILAREMGVTVDQLTPEASLDVDLGADSLTKVEIIMALEERFEVTIPDELSEHVQTVEDVYEAVGKVLGREG